MVSTRWWRRRSGKAQEEPGPVAPPLEVGQVWRYRTRSGEEDSRARILVLEQDPELGEIVHVRIEGVALPNPVLPANPNTVLGHVPIDSAAFRRSVTDLVGHDTGEPDLEGYREWRDAGGGVYALPLAETVAAVEATLTGGTYTAWIDDNVRLALEVLGADADFPMGLDRRSLVWVEAFLERQRENPEFDVQRLVPVLGSFLGQCVVEHGQGEWREDDNGWFVHLPGVDAWPFDKVAKQARYGRDGGESIVSFFDLVLQLDAEYDDSGGG